MSEPLTEQDAQVKLHEAACAAWIIDPMAAQVLGGNASGLRLLGKGALDAAMPAVVSLRSMSERQAQAGSGHRLLAFWTPAGIRRLTCRIEPVTIADGRLAYLIVALEPVSAGQKKSAVDGGSRPMDDAEILREIGRRIREGQKLLAAMGEAEVTPVSSNAAKLKVAEADASAQTPRGPASSTPAAASPSLASQTPVSKDDLAKLAHELKTPLSAIVAAAEIMRDERLGKLKNDRYRGYAADIYASATHATRIIERILTGGASAESARDFNFVQIDVNAIASSCFSSMKPIAEAAGLSLLSEFSAGALPLTVDETSLRQILLNLLTNAVKFARKGDEIRLVTRKDGNGATIIEVRDNGPGMSREEIARVAKATTKPQQRGTRPGGGMGIGLPLVRTLVEANAGRLKIESAKGKGTAITLVFSRNRLIAR